MSPAAGNRRTRLQALTLLSLSASLLLLLAVYLSPSQAADTPAELEPCFEKVVNPFLKKNCVRCHNEQTSMAGIRVDMLDPKLDENQIRIWEGMLHRISNGTMPPKGMPQPTTADRQPVIEWINRSLEVARLRPSPKNGLVRRLTVAQYRNTLRDLLSLDDDLTEILPPDAVSKDGFLNNKDTLQLTPLQLETYLEIAGLALNRAIVNPKQKPSIQNFRVDFGTGINPAPLPEKLVLGAGSRLLENPDFVVTQLTPKKPFPYEPFFMRTKYRFIEGYRGNDTVRGWREYDSIYHAVFADVRGSEGYPKGHDHNVVPQGLLLRPAIPNDGNFGVDSTYGPKANFKISLRELPNEGRFRVTVLAAKYNDGLLLDPGAKPQPTPALTWEPEQRQATINIPKPGIYQVDAFSAEDKLPAPDASHLNDGLTGAWPTADPATAPATGALEGAAKLVDSPLGKAIQFHQAADGYRVPHDALPTNDDQLVGEGDFSVAAWIRPQENRRAGIVSLAGTDRSQGWHLALADARGRLRFETASTIEEANAAVTSRPGVIRPNAWQHVAAVIRRGKNQVSLYVNGYLVARGDMSAAQFDDTSAPFQIGRVPGLPTFHGEIAAVRLYRRPLSDAEVQALLAPGQQFAKAPPERPQDLTLTLGDREFSGALKQPAFLVLRLEAGPLAIKSRYAGVRELDRVTFTPLAPTHDLAKRFATFEKRSPRLGVHLGLRRDCGSTLAPVGPPQAVPGTKLAAYVFEGAIRNFPSPDVEKENVNYLAGVREIGIRSEYTDGRDMPRLLIRSVEFEGPYLESWPPPSHSKIFVDFDRKSDQPAYAKRILHDFATRAYRRPVAPAEEASLFNVYAKAASDGRSFEDSIKEALMVALTSPQFLFLVETSKTPQPEPLDPYELASKLSYFLWNAPPDRRTLQLASSGLLQQQLDAEISRLIADARFSTAMREFASQWLSLDKFAVLEVDKKQFPKLTGDTRAQLKLEPVEFVRYAIRNNLPVRNLIQSDFIVANEAVATYYGLGDKVESGFDFVAIPTQRQDLGGLLTQSAIMAGLSDGRESNPVKRGAWLARKIIAEPPPDPPPNVPALKESSEGLTLRQRLEQHRNQTGCLQCHSRIDPWGVPFEEYDAGGRKKEKPVDARSTLPDKTEISGVNDLKRYLAEDRIDQVAFSFLKHLTTYATGRTLSYSELAFLKKDALQLKPGGYRLQDMVRYVVHSKMFMEK